MPNPAIDITATDLFGLGQYFNPQSSSSNHLDDMATVLDGAGNKQCETGGLFGRIEYTVEYRYCNGTPDIATDLSTALTAFGGVQNSIVLTGLVIRFSSGEYATVTCTGIQYDESAVSSGINTADVSSAIPAGAGFGVPALDGVVLGDNADYATAVFTFSCNHIAAKTAAGEHLASENLTFKGELSVEYTGTPSTAQPITDGLTNVWTTDTYQASDANTEFDSYQVTAHRYFDAA